MTASEDPAARPAGQDVDTAIRWFRDNPAALDVLSDSTMAVYYSAATVVRAVLAAGPDERADLSRLTKALDALDVPERENEEEREFHDGQRWMLGKVRTALRRIHDSGVSPGVDTWYRVEGGWRQDGATGGSMFVQDDTLPRFGPEGPGAALAGGRPAAETDGFDVGARVWSDYSGHHGVVVAGEACSPDRLLVRFDGEADALHVKREVLHPVTPKTPADPAAARPAGDTVAVPPLSCTRCGGEIEVETTTSGYYRETEVVGITCEGRTGPDYRPGCGARWGALGIPKEARR